MKSLIFFFFNSIKCVTTGFYIAYIDVNAFIIPVLPFSYVYLFPFLYNVVLYTIYVTIAIKVYKK